jgi:hypothetical protein
MVYLAQSTAALEVLFRMGVAMLDVHRWGAGQAVARCVATIIYLIKA